MNRIKHAAVCLGCAALSVNSFGSEVYSRPNVLFIVVDDLGWRDLGCYGSTFYESPHIDALASSSMLFTDAYAANPTCSPTRSSILTGQYPVRTGFTAPSGHQKGVHLHAPRAKHLPDVRAVSPSSVNFLSPDYYTLSEAFQDAGYSTAFLGKWHLGSAPHFPEEHGFEFVVGGREHAGPPGRDGTRKFFPPWSADTLPDDISPDTHIDDYLADRAVEYIDSHSHEPFFMCFWTYNVHAPIQSKPELVEKWRKKAGLNNPQHGPTMAAMIEVMDESVGRVLDALENNGIADNTIVIFTSDNGGNMYNTADGTAATNNEPLRSGKGNNYEGGVRIPLIVRWPGVTLPGSVSHSVVSTVDHYPALLEMVGLPLRPKDHIDGVSYVAALKGEPFEREALICDWSHHICQTHNLPNTSIREGNWKLLRFWFDNPDGSHRYELYNLADDIGESRDQSASFPERVQAMSEKLDAFYEQSGALKPLKNPAYNGRTIDVWGYDEKGDGHVSESAMVLKAECPGFTVSTRCVPWAESCAVFEFEARSRNQASVNIQWKSRTEDQFDASRSRDVAVPENWKTFRVQMDYQSVLRGLRIVFEKPGDLLEIRNARMLSPDGTQMMSYEFR
ncbi:sulfatase [Tichowtungia aerotolerans]|uniref:Sulfatase-like hydrolase/transferase n=1 Tax=Tichowtungia aerotolerans TaxID=2697043 RepID=A0A6P1M7V1_9BACT|nr:sulfatase [Tichowtungia aerotolerans]QHI69951.1 sulfatase-like hydrolase/transferase [Tichowtungia aerotolerans]